MGKFCLWSVCPRSCGPHLWVIHYLLPLEGKGWTLTMKEPGETSCRYQHHQFSLHRSTPVWPSVPTTVQAPIAGLDWIRTPRLPFPQFPPFFYDGDFSRCRFLTCRRDAIEMRPFPALSYDKGSPFRFTEILGEDYEERSRRAEARPPCRRSPNRWESPNQ